MSILPRIPWRKAAIIIGLLILALVLYLGFWPVPPDLPTEASADEPPSWPEVLPIAASGRTLTVQPGESIQEAVDRAQPGDTILISPGVYHEAVVIKTDGLTLRGVAGEDGLPVLDGEGEFGNGITATGHQLTLEGLIIRNYLTNGVVVTGAVGVVLRDLVAEYTGEYGVFPVQCKNVLIERVVAIGASDAGIYVGQSQDAVVRDSEAFANVSGIEIENSVNVLVENNFSHDNSAGLLVFVLPDLSRKETREVTVRGNRIENNNFPNFAEEGELSASVPRGTGILIVAADQVEVTANTITDNDTVGIGVVGLRQLLSDRSQFDVGVLPEGNWIHDNTIANNGQNPDPAAAEAGLPGADLLWDTSGWDNAWHEAATNAFPPLLPDRSWPDFLRRGYWRVMSFLASFL